MDEKDFGKEFVDRGRTVEASDVLETLRDPHVEAVVTLLERPSSQIFMATVEWELYPPQTAPNSLFQHVAIWWLKMAWRLIIYQKDDRRMVREIAHRFDLTLADGIPQKCVVENIPCFIGTKRYPASPGAQMFPVRAPNLYTLEYRAGSKLKHAERLKIELAALVALYRRHGIEEETLISMGLLDGRASDKAVRS